MNVPRIPRYSLLLMDLVKNTPENHIDYPMLSKAKTKISEIASFVNETKRVVENLNKVGEILSSISGMEMQVSMEKMSYSSVQIVVSNEKIREGR